MDLATINAILKRCGFRAAGIALAIAAIWPVMLKARVASRSRPFRM